MEKNIGNQYEVRRTKASTVWLIRLGAIAALVGLIAGGLFFLLNPVDPEDTIMGVVALVFAVIIFVALWIVSGRIQSEVAVHEEGVIVKKNKKEHRFHFSEIKGLIDNPDDASMLIFHGGGVADAVAAGIAAGVASVRANARARKSKARPMIIVANTEEKLEVSVLKAAGETLSQRYTQWLIKNKPVTKDNVYSLVLSFGDNLELNQGTFIHAHRRGDVHLPIQDVTSLETRENSLMFFAANEKGKNKCLIDIKITQVLNIDLLFEIFGMIAA